MWLIFLIIVVVIVAAVVLVVVGQSAPETDDDMLQQRLSELAAQGEEINLEELEMSQPFAQRVIYPFARKMGEAAARFTPQNQLQSTEKKLETAGNPGQMDATTFLSLRFISFGVVSGLMVLMMVFGSLTWSILVKILVVVGFSVLGFYLPQMFLQSKIERRQKGIRRSLPDALDLLTICVEAGLGFDAAMAKVTEKWQTDLSREFMRAIREVQLGKLRREALRDMADRINIPELSSFVAAVIQSEQLGVSMAKVLRIQADQMRMKRRQRAEEEAHKAPIKMLLPMAFLIFPSLLIILLTPAALKLMNSVLFSR